MSAPALLLLPLHLLAAPPPANDDLAHAAPISGLPFTYEVDTRDATTAPSDPNCYGNGSTVWYELTPKVDLRVLANTSGSDYDTTLCVYTGPPRLATRIARNDDTLDFQSAVVFEAEAGQTYYFEVGAFASGPGGHLVFEAEPAPPRLDIDVDFEPKAQLDALSGEATIHGTARCSTPVLIDLDGSFEQALSAQPVVNGHFHAEIECEGETEFSASVETFSGDFESGPARIVLGWAFACDELGLQCELAHEENVGVKLNGGV